MSAFMCSDLHINTLVAWAASFHNIRVSYYWQGKHHYFRDAPDKVAAILATANRESVYERYRKEVEGAPIPHHYKAPPLPLPDPVVILKLCECFDYQACEVDGYERTIAATIINAIRHRAIQALPGYEAAPWGI